MRVPRVTAAKLNVGTRVSAPRPNYCLGSSRNQQLITQLRALKMSVCGEPIRVDQPSWRGIGSYGVLILPSLRYLITNQSVIVSKADAKLTQTPTNTHNDLQTTPQSASAHDYPAAANHKRTQT